MTTKSTVNLDTSLRVADDVVWREVVGEAVILAVDGGRYFGLNDVGTRVWKGLIEGVSLRRIVEALTTEFDVDADRAELDALTLVQDLVDAGLLVGGAER